jgi:hypothetical protein
MVSSRIELAEASGFREAFGAAGLGAVALGPVALGATALVATAALAAGTGSATEAVSA